MLLQVGYLYLSDPARLHDMMCLLGLASCRKATFRLRGAAGSGTGGSSEGGSRMGGGSLELAADLSSDSTT